MGCSLAEAADELGCNERTLRRYISGGLLQGRRLARRRLELSDTEAQYLRDHWALLSGLMGALRSEREVRLAVLFGSTATGEDDALSDVDLLIGHHRSDPRAQAALKLRLCRALGNRVDVVSLEQARLRPSLLADVLREGRLLVDRDDLWASLQRDREQVLRRAHHEDELIATRASATIAAAGERLAAA